MSTRPTVVLLHGLLQRSTSMMPCAFALKRQGFGTKLFDYASCFRSLEHAIERLERVIEPLQNVHLVGHSLGGIVSVMACQKPETAAKVSRIVCLGSPLNGSGVAGVVHAWPAPFRSFIGRNAERLSQPLPSLPKDIAVGNIAGTRRMGVDRLLTKHQDISDGTVRLAETKHPKLTDHISIHTSHTMMVVNHAVHQQIIHFLNHGCFDHSDMTPNDH